MYINCYLYFYFNMTVAVWQLLLIEYVVLSTCLNIDVYCTAFLHNLHGSRLVLLRWQEFATWSVAVFFLTRHRGAGAVGGGEYQSVSRLGC